MGGRSAVFVGDGSLLIRCAQEFIGAGNTVTCVASHSEEVLQWARTNGIAARALLPGAPVSIDEAAFDYLFSVANLSVLPTALISRAGKMAINFHDGPLPRYAGLNAPSWALMAGELQHGVTWHEMTVKVDAGRVVRQASFPIAPDETAFS